MRLKLTLSNGVIDTVTVDAEDEIDFIDLIEDAEAASEWLAFRTSTGDRAFVRPTEIVSWTVVSKAESNVVPLPATA